MVSPIGTTRSLGKDSGRRVDFTDTFDLKVRQKGLRVLWSRAILCSCRLNSKTDQADPSCPSCGGDGWYYVLPVADRPEAYDEACFFDTATAKASQIIVTGMEKNVEIYETFGEWVFGSIRCTPFSFHKVAYRDRLTFVDGLTQYQQLLRVPASRSISVGRGQKTEVRYPVRCVLHALEIQDDGTRVDRTAAFTANADGTLTIASTVDGGPPDDALITLVYEYNPTYIVLQSVLDLRQSPRKFKTTSVLGDLLDFPKLLLAKPDYLPDQ